MKTSNNDCKSDQRTMATPQSSIIATRTPPRMASISGSEETRNEIGLSFNHCDPTGYYGLLSTTKADELLVGPSTSSTESGFRYGSPSTEHGAIRGRVPGVSPPSLIDFPGSPANAGRQYAQRTNINSSTGTMINAVINAMSNNTPDVTDVCSVGSSNRCPNSPIIFHNTTNSNAANSSVHWDAICGNPTTPVTAMMTRPQGLQPTATAVTYNSADPAQDEDFEVNASKPLVVFGYLSKKTRNGMWQKRYFETDGERLSYYKSKRTKLLASLDLANVGEIVQDLADTTGCSFTVQVAGRPYYLRAQDRSTCKDWVINLNRVREARNRIGRMQLVSNHDEQKYVSRVVVSANRCRLHRLNSDDDIPEYDMSQSPLGLPHMMDQSIAGWEKRTTGFKRMRNRLIVWARKIRLISCFSHEQDVVQQHSASTASPMRSNDQHYMPHGTGLMSDGTDTVGESESKDETADNSKAIHSSWIAKETQISGGILARVDNQDYDDGTRTLS